MLERAVLTISHKCLNRTFYIVSSDPAQVSVDFRQQGIGSILTELSVEVIEI